MAEAQGATRALAEPVAHLSEAAGPDGWLLTGMVRCGIIRCWWGYPLRLARGFHVARPWSLPLRNQAGRVPQRLLHALPWADIHGGVSELRRRAPLFHPADPAGILYAVGLRRCRNDPAGKRPARAWLLLFGLVAGLVAMGVVFSVPWPDNDIEAKWGLRAIFTAFTSLVLYNLVRTDRGAYREARENVAPLGHDRCPYCGEPLPSMPEPPCGKCRVRVL